MSVVVRMEMPKDCLYCPMVHFDMLGNLQGCEAKPGKRYLQGKKDEFWEKGRPSWCPILCQLPEGHGRLVDMRDIDSMMEDALSTSDESGLYSLIYRDDLDFDGLPTIVPAERSEEK